MADFGINPINAAIPLGVQAQQPGMNLSDMLNMARSAQAFQQAQQVNPLQAELAKTQLEQAQGTLKPSIRKAEAEASQQELKLTADQLQFEGGIVTGLEKALKSGDKKRINLALQGADNLFQSNGQNRIKGGPLDLIENSAKEGDYGSALGHIQTLKDQLATNAAKYQASLPQLATNAANQFVSFTPEQNQLSPIGSPTTNPSGQRGVYLEDPVSKNKFFQVLGPNGVPEGAPQPITQPIAPPGAATQTSQAPSSPYNFSPIVEGGRLSSVPGVRGGQMHYGVDIAAPTGTPITAPTIGKVISAGAQGAGGNTVVIKGEDGKEYSFMHMANIGVKVGDEIAPGQPLGTVGATGNATGPHVHYQVKGENGKYENPLAPFKVEAQGITPQTQQATPQAQQNAPKFTVVPSGQTPETMQAQSTGALGAYQNASSALTDASKPGHIPTQLNIAQTLLTKLKNPKLDTGPITDMLAGKTRGETLSAEQMEVAKLLQQRIQNLNPRTDADAESKKAAYGSLGMKKPALIDLVRRDIGNIYNQKLLSNGIVNSAGDISNPNLPAINQFQQKFQEYSQDPVLMQYMGIIGTGKTAKVDEEDKAALQKLFSENKLTKDEINALEKKRKEITSMSGVQ